MKKLILISLLSTLLFSGCYYRDQVDMAYESYVKNRDNCGDSQCKQVAAQQFAGQVDNIANNWEKWHPPTQMKAVPPVETKQEVKFDPAQKDIKPFTPAMPISKDEEKKQHDENQCGQGEAPFKEEGCVDEEAKALIESRKKSEKLEN